MVGNPEERGGKAFAIEIEFERPPVADGGRPAVGKYVMERWWEGQNAVCPVERGDKMAVRTRLM